MRTFYIFSIKDYLNPIYQDKTRNVYSILKNIKEMDKRELLLAKKRYMNVINVIDRKKIDNYLLMNYMNNFYYTKKVHNHELHSEKEYSKLEIYNTFIKIKTNNISSFFKDLYNINKNYFIVDFDNKDYFYLEDLKLKLLV